jgi:hypothetical protein
MTRHIGAVAVCIFMLGMMTGYLLSLPAPTVSQVKVQTISPEAITKTERSQG